MGQTSTSFCFIPIHLKHNQGDANDHKFVEYSRSSTVLTQIINVLKLLDNREMENYVLVGILYGVTHHAKNEDDSNTFDQQASPF